MMWAVALVLGLLIGAGAATWYHRRALDFGRGRKARILVKGWVHTGDVERVEQALDRALRFDRTKVKVVVDDAGATGGSVRLVPNDVRQVQGVGR